MWKTVKKDTCAAFKKPKQTNKTPKQNKHTTQQQKNNPLLLEKSSSEHVNVLLSAQLNIYFSGSSRHYSGHCHTERHNLQDKPCPRQIRH